MLEAVSEAATSATAGLARPSKRNGPSAGVHAEAALQTADGEGAQLLTLKDAADLVPLISSFHLFAVRSKPTLTVLIHRRAELVVVCITTTISIAR